MADNTQQQAQTLTLDNGNAAQNQYLSYYNQLISQLGGNNANTVSYNAITQVPQAQAQLMQNPTQLQAQQIQSPGQLTWQGVAAPQTLNAQLINAPTVSAQQIAAADKITPGTINVERQTEEDLARQVSAYLRPYTENAINARRAQTGKDRAAADVDAASRGMGSSTWLSDAKNRMAAAEASDITAMENDAGMKTAMLRVDGGASANNFLMQFQADVLNASVLRPRVIETTAMGAAMMAARAVGHWSDADLRRLQAADREFTPQMDEVQRRRLLHNWRKAVERSKGWAEEE